MSAIGGTFGTAIIFGTASFITVWLLSESQMLSTIRFADVNLSPRP